MRRVFGILGAMTLLLTFVFMGSVGTALAAPHWNKDDGHYQHIFVIMMENHSTDEIFGNTADAPYTNWLASKAAVSTDYYGVTHPSHVEREVPEAAGLCFPSVWSGSQDHPAWGPVSATDSE